MLLIRHTLLSSGSQLKTELIYMSPRWGLDMWVLDATIHISPRWGYGSGKSERIPRPGMPNLWELVSAPIGWGFQPVGRDSYLDIQMSILENRPTEVRYLGTCRAAIRQAGLRPPLNLILTRIFRCQIFVDVDSQSRFVAGIHVPVTNFW